LSDFGGGGFAGEGTTGSIAGSETFAGPGGVSGESAVLPGTGGEGGGEPAQQGSAGAGDTVVDPLSAALALEEAGETEDLEMARDGRLGHPEDVGELADAEGLVEEEPEEPPAGLVGESLGEGDEVSHRKKT